MPSKPAKKYTMTSKKNQIKDLVTCSSIVLYTVRLLYVVHVFLKTLPQIEITVYIEPITVYSDS